MKAKVSKKNKSLIRISKDIIVKSPKEKTKKLIVYLTIKSHKIVLSNNVLNKFSRKFLNNFPYIETKVRTIILNKRMKTINENNLLKPVSNNQYQKRKYRK